MSFIPDMGDRYWFATHLGVCSGRWSTHPTNIRVARGAGIFQYTANGRELAAMQHAFLVQTSMFWEWVDSYELHT